MLAVGVYSALAVAFFGWPLADLSSRCACGRAPDAELFMWFLSWWPHALLSGVNPFFTHAVFVPDGLNVASATSIPGVSLLAWPLTAAVGPLAAYNLVALLAPVLSGWGAFALCRYLTGDTGPALVGGAMFGFSTYEVAQLLGHPHLDLVFLLPIAALLFLRMVDQRVSPRLFVALMTATVVLQLLISTEVTAMTCLVGMVAVIAAYLASGAQTRGRLRLTGGYTLVAVALAGVVTSPFLYYALFKGFPSQNLRAGDRVAIDGLGWFLPMVTTRFGSQAFAGVTRHFTSAEFADAYVPLPLLALAAAALIALRRTISGRVAAAIVLTAGVLSLGAHLHIAGTVLVALPWRLVENAPGFDEIAPGRFAVFVTLALAVLTAAALRRGLPWPRLRWAAAAIGLVLLIPNTAAGLWRFSPNDPRFFTTGTYRRVLVRNELVLNLPTPIRDPGPNLWQAQTNFYFRVADGYLNQIFPPDYTGDPLWSALVSDRVSRSTAPQLRSFLSRHGVNAVLVDAADPGPWPAVLSQIGLRPQAIAGMLVYQTGRPAPLT